MVLRKRRMLNAALVVAGPKPIYRIMKYLFWCALVILILGCQSRDMQSGSLSTSGEVVRILDGDTYEILFEDSRTERIRMEGIDAPERGMPYYNVSKKYLGQLCFKETIQLDVHETDRYGRKIAFAYLPDGRELSHEMFKAGLAWHYTKYNSDRDMSLLEEGARQSRIGLWKDERPMAPWDNRRYHRNGISTKDSFNIHTGNR